MIPNNAADSVRVVVPIFKKRTGFVSLQAPPRGTVSIRFLEILLTCSLGKNALAREFCFLVKRALSKVRDEECCFARTPFVLRIAARPKKLRVESFMIV